jgi:hypothetical protein
MQRLAVSAVARAAAALRFVADAGRSLALAFVPSDGDPGSEGDRGQRNDCRSGRPVSSAAIRRSDKHAFSFRDGRIEVRSAAFGSEAGLVGAAALAMDEFIYQLEAEMLSELPSTRSARYGVVSMEG